MATIKRSLPVLAGLILGLASSFAQAVLPQFAIATTGADPVGTATATTCYCTNAGDGPRPMPGPSGPPPLIPPQVFVDIYVGFNAPSPHSKKSSELVEISFTMIPIPW